MTNDGNARSVPPRYYVAAGSSAWRVQDRSQPGHPVVAAFATSAELDWNAAHKMALAEVARLNGASPGYVPPPAESAPAPKWPKGFEPDPAAPRYLNESLAHSFFAERVGEAATQWAREHVTDEDQREWAEGFGEWAARRWASGAVGAYRMPQFASWWRAYYAEPVRDGTEDDGPEPVAQDD